MDRGGIFIIQQDELSYKSPGELLMLPYVAFSSMVTGKTPAYTGIRKSGDSDLKCDTVFETLSRSSRRHTVYKVEIQSENKTPAVLKVYEGEKAAALCRTERENLERLHRLDLFSGGEIFGIDFEEMGFGDFRQDLSEVCFFLLTDYPPLTPEKDRMVRRFLKAYAKHAGKSIDNMDKLILKSRSNARIRRAKSSSDHLC